MPAVSYLYRSKKPKAPLEVRLFYRENGENFLHTAKSQIEVSNEYWSKIHKQKRPKDIDVIKLQAEIRGELDKLSSFILSSFKSRHSSINKAWLQNVVNEYYSPITSYAPANSLLKYTDFYIERKSTELRLSTLKKCNVIKQMLSRFQMEKHQEILIQDIDQNFKYEFENYCLRCKYSPNTISRALRFVKTVCKDAQFNGVSTHIQLDSIKIKYQTSEHIYLSEDEVDLIEKCQNLSEILLNARDWLLISCYTGQRISDFMRFTEKMIRHEANRNGKIVSLIEFTQVKTGKVMTVPLSDRVIEILNRRDGKFPPKMSDQKYNMLIKEVCRKSGICKEVSGSKMRMQDEDSKLFRKSTGNFKKWELVTSHIGRRSFATNNYGKIPTSFLIYISGHSSEALFRTYLGKSNSDLALEISNYF